jgi:HK97 family phage portal protein
MRDLSVGGWQVLVGSLNNANADDKIWMAMTALEREQAFENASIVYICISKILNAIQEPPLRLWRGYGEDREELVLDSAAGIEDAERKMQGLGWALRLMRLPYPGIHWNAWMKHNVLHLLLTGYDYLWKLRNRAGQVNRVLPTPTSWIETKRNDDGEIVRYDVAQGTKGKKDPVSLEDMAVAYLPDPNDLQSGIGPLQAATRDYQLDRMRENYLGEMLTNMPAPGAVLKQTADWDEPAKQHMREVLRNTVGASSQRRGDPLFVHGENVDIEFPAPLKDLDWPGLAMMTESRVCSAYGVPAMVAGVRAGLERSTYNNYGEAVTAFYNMTLKPLWKFLANWWTMGLLWEEGVPVDVYFEFDLTDVQELKQDDTKLQENAATLFKADLITRNQAMELMGMEAFEEQQGDVFLIPATHMEVPLQESGITVPPDIPPEEDHVQPPEDGDVPPELLADDEDGDGKKWPSKLRDRALASPTRSKGGNGSA